MKHKKENRFATLQDSIDKLRRPSDCGRRRKPGIIQRAIEELQSALGELQVIEEELRFQHDELMMARKDAEDRRRRYHQMFDFIPDGCLVTDTSGKIREANRAAGALLKVEPESLAGRQIADLVGEDKRPEFLERLSQMIELRRITDWQVEIRSSGVEQPFEARLSVEVVLDASDQVAGLQWVMKPSESK